MAHSSARSITELPPSFDQITLSALKAAISTAEKPHSRSIASVSAPSAGAGLRGASPALSTTGPASIRTGPYSAMRPRSATNGLSSALGRAASRAEGQLARKEIEEKLKLQANSDTRAVSDQVDA